jgi:hypothetical protein
MGLVEDGVPGQSNPMLFIPVLGADIVRCLRRLSRANRKEPTISKLPLRKENAFFLSGKNTFFL